MSGTPRVPPVPAVLRLVQMAVLGRWRATVDELYREVAQITEAGPQHEILISGCGTGEATEWFALRTSASVTGVDPDAESLEVAESRARTLATAAPIQYAQAPLDDLPHETEVFDIAIGEPALSATADPARAVDELVRVTRPMGSIILLQPSWSSEVAEHERELIVERLGLRPHLLIEWKQMLRDAGVVEIQIEDWTSGPPGGRAPGAAGSSGPPHLTWRQKMQIVARAWRRRGWHEARSAVARETTLIRELSRERTIGFQLLKGIKWPHATAV
ncbi:MAG TPA: methyltransferase domain-containing protein [Gemmatimonadaceae bacterium]|nr:methyltransferase domain-containing protein [Gemmatimonadaceae bacterium]